MENRETSRLAVVVLAAGKGTRMKSDLPKVLHLLAGRPLVEYPLDLAQGLKADLVILVVGHQAGRVRRAVGQRPGVRYALQEPQLGTGHAVMAAVGELRGFQGEVLILSGDVPGLRRATASALLDRHRAEKNALTVLAMDLAEPGAYGRLISGPGGLTRIVEFRDASPSQRAIRLVNAGIYVVGSRELLSGLQHVEAENDQQEYYLTDLVEVLAGQGLKVGYEVCADAHEVKGVNSPQELADWEARLSRGAAKRH